MQVNVSTLTVRAVAFVSLSVLLPFQVNAQGAEENAASSVLEEIMVSARRREESLTDVPVAVSAFTEAVIQEAAILELRNIAENTAGVVYNERDGDRSQAYIGVRGFKQFVASATGQRASTFLNSMPVAGNQAAVQLVDVVGVEVYRGPQSAAFGRSVFAGAVNYALRQPSLDDPFGGVDLQYGEDGRARVAGFYSMPIVEDKLGVYLSGAIDEYDGPGGVVSSDGFAMGARETEYYSLALRFQPTDALGMTLRYSNTELDDGPSPDYNLDPATDSNIVLSPTPGRAPLYVGKLNFADQPALNRNFCVNDGNCVLDPGFELERERLSLEASYEFGNGHTVDLRALTSEDSQFNIDDQDNTDFAPGPGVFVVNMGNEVEIDEDYVEVVWSTPDDARLRGLLGYSQYDYDLLNVAYFVHPEADLIDGSGSTPSIFSQTVKNRGVFGGLFYDLTDSLTVSFEGRQQRDDISASDPDPTDQNFPVSESDTFLPRIALSYAFRDELNFYVQYSEGVRPASINTAAVAPLQRATAAALAEITVNGQTFASAEPFLDDVLAVDEETLKNYEIGMKGVFLEGRMNLNLAIFHMETDGYAETGNLFYFPDGVDSQDVLDALSAYGAATNNPLLDQPLNETALRMRGDVNIAKLETQGFEVEGTYVPTENWRFTGQLTYLDTTFDTGCVPIGADFGLELSSLTLPSGGTLNCTDISNNAFPFIPELQFGLQALYTRELSNGWNLFTRANVRYQDEQYMDWFEAGLLPSSARWDLRAGVDSENWRLEAYVVNLTDDRTPLGAQYEPARNEVAAFTGNGGPPNNTGLNVAIAYPREVGMRVSYRF